MTAADVTAVMAIADSLPQAPHWPPSAYLAALDPAAQPVRLALVAEDGQARIVGFIVLALIAAEVELESIAVASQAQRRGIARALIHSAIHMLKSGGCSAVFLEVRASNGPARALYAMLGFLETGSRPGYYASPVEDAVVMCLNF